MSGDRFVRACPQHNVEIYESPEGLRCPKGNHPVGKWKVVDRLKGLAVSAATAEDGEVEVMRESAQVAAPATRRPLSSRLSEEKKAEVRELFRAGVPRREIATRLKITHFQAWNYSKGEPKPSRGVIPSAPRPTVKAVVTRGRPPKKRAKALAIVAKPAAPLAVSLPQIQQDLASYKGRLLADLREVERAIEAMTLVQHAWESQHSAGRQAATRR